MSRLGAWVRGAGAGATAMYFFDPDCGRRRRALVRDQAIHLSRVARDELETELRDARNRIAGTMGSLRRIASGAKSDVSDASIEQALRSRFARLDRPDAIAIEVREGCVYLRGPVLARDAERARRAVRRVRGARSLVDELEVHATADVPALAEQAAAGLAQMDPSTRLTVGLVGAAAVLPLFRHLPLLATARLLAFGGVVAAITSVERARRRAIEHGPGRGAQPAGRSGQGAEPPGGSTRTEPSLPVPVATPG